MTAPRRRDDDVDRFSAAIIKRVTGWLLVVMAVVVGGGLLLGLLADEFIGRGSAASDAAGFVVVGGLIGPLWVASVSGGCAIHRWGWVPGLLLLPSVVACGAGLVVGGWWAVWGTGALVAVGAGSFVAGYEGGVPMCLSPVVGVRGPVVDEGPTERRGTRAEQRRSARSRARAEGALPERD